MIKKITSVWFLLVFGCGSVSPDQQSDSELRQLVRAHDAAWNAHDATAMTALFAEDATVLSPSGELAKGRDALRAMFTSPSPTNKTTSTTTFTKPHWVGPDIVLIDAVQKLDGPGTAALGASQARVVFVARYLEHAWKIVAARPFVSGSPEAVQSSERSVE